MGERVIASILFCSYIRYMQAPENTRADETNDGVTERMLDALLRRFADRVNRRGALGRIIGTVLTQLVPVEDVLGGTDNKRTSSRTAPIQLDENNLELLVDSLFKQCGSQQLNEADRKGSFDTLLPASYRTVTVTPNIDLYQRAVYNQLPRAETVPYESFKARYPQPIEREIVLTLALSRFRATSRIVDDMVSAIPWHMLPTASSSQSAQHPGFGDESIANDCPLSTSGDILSLSSESRCLACSVCFANGGGIGEQPGVVLDVFRQD